jgi:hypothetical protein
MKKIYIIALVYILAIATAVVYFGVMQHFGHRGLVFDIGGRDRIFGLPDILIPVVTIASIFLLILSLIAFKRTNDTRILILSLAFFFFMLHALLEVLDNFFPREFIFINNATAVLEFLVLLSFIMLIYSSYKRSEKIVRQRVLGKKKVK